MKGREAMMAVMRKMLIVAYRLLKTGQMYDPTKVGVVPVVQSTAEPSAESPPSSDPILALA